MSPKSTNRILVTGGAGFIGSHLVDHFVDAGEAVTVLDDLSSGRRKNLDEASDKGDLRFIEGSILDPRAVKEAMRGCDRVYHLAVRCVRLSLGAPMDNHEVNATGTLATLEAAREAQVSRFVYCSSSEVYGNAFDGVLDEARVICEPVTVYGAAKLAGEYYTKAYGQTYGLPVTIVRPFNSYGPREHDQGALAEVVPRFVIRCLNGLSPMIFGDGSNGRDFTYVAETARGIALAGACDALIGDVVNIAYGHLVTIRELAETVIALCGSAGVTPDYLAARPGDVHVLRASTVKAERILGFKAEVGLQDGLGRYLDWFRATYSDPSALLEDRAVNWVMPPECGPEKDRMLHAPD